MKITNNLTNNLGFVFQIGLKFLAIALGVLVFRFQNTQFSQSELAEFTQINAYTITILGLITFGIPQIIQKFYTQNYQYFDQKKQEFAEFWTVFLIFRLFSYLIAILIIFLTFKLSGSNNLLSIIGVFSAQFIILIDLNFRSVVDSVGKSWQFSLSDFLGKLILVLGLFIIIIDQSFINFVRNFDLFSFVVEISNFSWFIILSILAYLTAFCLDFFWQKKFTPITFPSSKTISKIWVQNHSEIIFLGLSGFLTSLFLRTDILILNYFQTNSNQLIGYSNSYRLFEIASVVPSLVVPVLVSRFWQKCQAQSMEKIENNSQETEQKLSIPKIEAKNLLNKSKFTQNLSDNSSKNQTNDKIQLQILQKNLQTFIFGIFILGLICTGLLGFLAPIGLLIIDPMSRYSDFSLQTVWILAGMLIFNSLSIFLGNLNILLGGFRVELAISFGNLVVAMISYFVFIPNFGIVGAAFASLIIYGFDVVLRIFFLWQTWQKYNKDN